MLAALLSAGPSHATPAGGLGRVPGEPVGLDRVAAQETICPSKGVTVLGQDTSAADSPLDQPLEWKIGQMLMAGVAGTDLSDDARHLLGDLHVGNVVLMGPNVQSPSQVLGLTRRLQALALQANGVGLLIATDQEGGRVQRLSDGFTRLPDAATVGRVGRPELIRGYGAVVGDELRGAGVNMDLAPVLDVNDNPANPVIGDRAFGSTPPAVEAAALPFLAGLHDAGVAATGKHFPGHGNTSTDSHFALPVVPKDRAELEQTELRPFRAAITAGLDAVMLAHVVYPALDPSGLPATVSAPIATCLLREALGFDGVVLTDDMGMQGIADVYPPEEAAVQAVRAGADVVLCARLELAGACGPDTFERLRVGLLQAAADGRLSSTRIDASVRRILALKARYPADAGPVLAGSRGGADHEQVVQEVEAAAEQR